LDPNGTYIGRMGRDIEVIPIPFESIRLPLAAKPQKSFPPPFGSSYLAKRSPISAPAVGVGGSGPINVW
jgi:hypothetical protein